jgi:hypothetical protein
MVALLNNDWTLKEYGSSDGQIGHIEEVATAPDIPTRILKRDFRRKSQAMVSADVVRSYWRVHPQSSRALIPSNLAERLIRMFSRQTTRVATGIR